MTHSAQFAAQAWRERQRRRVAAAVLDRVADAALAAGGAVVANTALALQLGLPAGGGGIALGAGLLAAGIYWMMRGRHCGIPRPAYSVRTSVPRPSIPVTATATAARAQHVYDAA